MTSRQVWERIQPGYYRLRGTDVYIADMRGSSVKWSGLILETWEVRTEPPLRRGAEPGRLRGTYRTMREAKERAIQWAREEGWM